MNDQTQTTTEQEQKAELQAETEQLSHDEKIILLKKYIGDEIADILIHTYTPEFLEQYLDDNIKILLKSRIENLKAVKDSFDNGEVSK